MLFEMDDDPKDFEIKHLSYKDYNHGIQAMIAQVLYSCM